MQAVMDEVLGVFSPNKKTSMKASHMIVIIQVVFFLAIWIFYPWKLMPNPLEVFEAFTRLWNQGFAQELYTSFLLNLEALAITSVISLTLAYSSVMPAFRPIIVLISKFRFMGLVGWSVIFTLTFGGGHYLKISLMVFAMTAFMLTSMAAVVVNIPREQFDHARTLRMSEWRVVWEVVILGTLDQALDVIRQNAAIGWTMLTMVEGLSRSEGGIGVMLISQNKFFKLDGIFAIQLSIFFLALSQDWFIGVAHKFLFPYAHLNRERK